MTETSSTAPPSAVNLSSFCEARDALAQPNEHHARDLLDLADALRAEYRDNKDKVGAPADYAAEAGRLDRALRALANRMCFKTTNAGANNLKHASVYWLVDQYIPADGLTVLYGEPNTGKTFFALDLAWHVAHGKPWFGREVQWTQVLYVALEGTIKPRLKALRDATGWDGGHFHFAELGSLELEPGSGDLLKLMETLEALPQPPYNDGSDEPSLWGSLVVLDPMVQAFVGEENNTAAMTRFVTAIKSLSLPDGWPVTKLLVHHSGKDPNRGARGSSVLRGAVDAEVNVRGQRGVRTAVVTKQRDAEKASPLAFTLASCGSSCRVVPSDSEDNGVASDALSAAILAELEDSGEEAAASYFYPMATRFLMKDGRGPSDRTVQNKVGEALKALVESGRVVAYGENRYRRYRAIPVRD